MYRYDIDIQFDDTANELYVSLRQLSNKISLVAELSKNYNVHYHGIISLKGSKRKFINYFRNDKKFGFVNASPIKNEENVFSYIQKDVVNTYQELDRRPIIKDDYNIFPLKSRMLYGREF